MDDIQRKLALIDKQLSGGFFDSYQRIISTSPLVFAAVGLILGILIQDALLASRFTFHASQLFWLILLALCVAGSFIFFAIQRISFNNQSPVTNHQSFDELKMVSKVEPLPITNYQYATAYLALICFTCLGAIRLTSFYGPKPNDIRNFVGNEKNLTAENAKSAERELKLNSADSVVKENVRKLATIRGLIITDPYINRNENWKFVRFKFTDPDTSFYLKLGELKTVDGWSKVSGTVRVQVAGPILDLKAGDFIQAYCWLDRFEPPTNPGQFDIAKYLARKNVFIAASIPSRDAIEVLQGSSTGFLAKIKRKAREVVVQSLLGSTYPQDESERLLQALVLGYRAEMSIATYEAFRKTGLLHFVCLSGMNFGILVGLIWWLCKIAGLMKRARAVVCIIAAAMFVLVIPSNPPAFRAAIICIVFCLSFFFRRRSNPFNSLAISAVILLMIKPTDLFDTSWQLSFATVLGILLFAKPVEDFISGKLTALFEDPLTGKLRPCFRIVSNLASPIIAVFSVSFVAWLTSAGILLYNFYTVQLLTSIWTVIASPFIAVISFLGYLKLLIGLVLPTVASILDVIIRPLSNWLIWIVKYIAQRDFSQVLVGKVSPAVIILYYAFLLIVFFAHFHRPLAKKVICTAVALVIIVCLGNAKWQRIHRDNLVLTCLDVSHGQAILAQLPGKANVLFDVGSLHKGDIGRRVVAPFLDYSGINKLDAVIISHNGIDQLNGIPEIVEHCKVRAVYADEVFVDEAQKGGAAKFLSKCLLEQGREINTLGKNLSLQSDANIKIIWPVEQLSPTDGLSDNDKSMVCLLEFADKKILLCSDIEKFAQGELLRLYPQLKADVVVVPHHGSIRTTDPDFLDALDADILLCSCSRSQYERCLESRDTLVRRSFSEGRSDGSRTSRVFYTAADGAIIVSVDKKGKVTTDVFIK